MKEKKAIIHNRFWIVNKTIRIDLGIPSSNSVLEKRSLSKSNKHYEPKFKKEWLSNLRFSVFLRRRKSDSTKALCCIRNVQFSIIQWENIDILSFHKRINISWVSEKNSWFPKFRSANPDCELLKNYLFCRWRHGTKKDHFKSLKQLRIYSDSTNLIICEWTSRIHVIVCFRTFDFRVVLILRHSYSN